MHLEMDKKHHPAAVAAAGLTTLDFPFVSDIVRSRILSTLIVGAEKCFTWRRLGGFIRDVSSGTPTTDGWLRKKSQRSLACTRWCIMWSSVLTAHHGNILLVSCVMMTLVPVLVDG